MIKEFVIKNKLIVFLLIFSIAGGTPNMAKAEMNPKIAALLTMAGYGTVCGALLGLASQLAFDTGGRSISQGASFGLYAGMLFGGYVVGSYYMKKNSSGKNQDMYDPKLSPYDSGGYYQKSDQYMNFETYNLPAVGNRYIKRGNKSFSPEIYFNLLRFQF